MIVRYRHFALVLGLLLALTATLTSAAGRGGLLQGRGVSLPSAIPAQQTTCTTMKATSDARWLATDEQGEATDEEITSYPSGTLAIAAVFDYNCLPKGATIVTVFALDGEVVFSNKAAQKPGPRPGSYSYVLSRDSEEPMPDGEWEVGFFNNKTMLTSSTITVGGDASGVAPISDSVTAQGTVTDAKTKKPIRDVLVIVLNEGVSAQSFVRNPKDALVFARTSTDARGQFVFETPIERSVGHSWIIAAKGYKPLVEDDLLVGEDADDPLELNITLTK